MNNFYNVIREIFELNIIEKDKHLTICIEYEAGKMTQEIKNIKKLKRITSKEVRTEIYNKLLSFYNNIEYDCLLSGRVQKT